MKLVRATLLAIFLSMNNAYAVDITKDVSAGTTGPDNSNGGYLELGIGLVYRAETNSDERKTVSPITVSGAYRYKGFFVEASKGVSDGISLGYNAWTGTNWAVDLIGANTYVNLSDWAYLGPGPIRTSTPIGRPIEYETLTPAEVDALNSFIDDSLADSIRRDKGRDLFYATSGIRVTGYFGNAILQYRLMADLNGDHGIQSAARFGYSWQIKNWNLYSVLQAGYNSRKTNQFWYGISDEQASSSYPAYNLGSTVEYSAEMGATYPLTENLIFRTTVQNLKLPDEIADSPAGPLRLGNNSSEQPHASQTVISTVISYVF